MARFNKEDQIQQDSPPFRNEGKAVKGSSMSKSGVNPKEFDRSGGPKLFKKFGDKGFKDIRSQ